MNNIAIKEHFTMLHFDAFPILFIGNNDTSQVVIGSFICENDDDNTLKYFHSIVSTTLASKFLKRKMSYLDVLKAASFISIVTKDYNDNILNIEEKKYSEINKSYLPLSFSFCPEIENKTNTEAVQY